MSSALLVMTASRALHGGIFASDVHGFHKRWRFRGPWSEIPAPVCAVQAARSVDAEAESAIAVSQYHANTDADEVDLALVEALLMYVCGEGAYKREGEDPDAAQGAVLIFLPGQHYMEVLLAWHTSGFCKHCSHHVGLGSEA